MNVAPSVATAGAVITSAPDTADVTTAATAAAISDPAAYATNAVAVIAADATSVHVFFCR